MRRFAVLLSLIALVLAPGGLFVLNAQDEEPTPALPVVTPAAPGTADPTPPPDDDGGDSAEAEATPAPPPQPVVSQTVDGVTLDLFFGSLEQGGAGVLRVTLAEGVALTDLRGRFLNRDLAFFTVDHAPGHFAVVAAGMEQNPRVYALNVVAQTAAGSISLDVDIDVTTGGFIRQDLEIPPDRAYLIDPEVERGEFARLSAVLAESAPQRLWDNSGFRLPVESEFTSPFGSFRTFNNTVETRHTGWDLRAATGTPVVATASGVVAFAGLLDIRGNHVIIDHGLGIASGYSHLSQIHVTRGQSVRAGQIIGVSGNTGRSGGAHLHWEITVAGEWIDAADFYALWLP